MNREKGSPFRSSSLEQELLKYNEGVSINEGGSSNSNVRSSLCKRKATSVITFCFPSGAAPLAQCSIKAQL